MLCQRPAEITPDKEGSDWKVTTVDFRGRTNGVYDVGMGNSIVIDKDGKPCISYEDGEDIKFAHPDGDNWKVDTIDSFHPLGSWVGYRTSLAFDSQGHPHIAYDAGGTLKHAFGMVRSGTSRYWRGPALADIGIRRWPLISTIPSLSAIAS